MRLRIILLLMTYFVCGSLSAASFDEERAKAEKIGLQGNQDEYLFIIKQLSDQGDAPSQAIYGNYLANEGQKAEAERLLKLAADTGNDEGQRYLANFYLLNDYPNKSTEAKRLLELSAAQGNSRAKAVLATLTSNSKRLAVTDGKVSISELVDINYAQLRVLFEINENFIKCYHVKPEEIDSLFGPPVAGCKEAVIEEYGDVIAVKSSEEMLEILREINACVRYLVLDSKNISENELLQCSSQIK